ncbi:MAG: NAD(P)/FAD-dependent oxidoreductase [Methanomassiliicoccales archaeon]|nr:NAD(P)/FAD-dependent oxidoreductase [Methanomassiliicoccales archaeon]
MRCDVLVVGGGPVGCTAASVLAPALDTVVVEEHPCIGEPVQCAGLVTPRVVDLASAWDTVINRIDGAYVHFPGGRTLILQGSEVKAVVVRRGDFDRRCAFLAEKTGARVLTSKRCLSVRRDADGLVADIEEGEEVRCRALVAADGYRSKVAKQLGLGEPRDLLRGIEADLRVRMEDQGKVNVYLGRDVAPGFFAWAIPCGDLTRVGLCVTPGGGTPQSYLERLLERQGWAGAVRERTYSGAIPLGHLERTYAERVLLAGDAAGMTKPLSGGGLYTGMTAGRMAAETLIEAFRQDDLSAQNLSSYEERWKGEFGSELRNSFRVRRVFVKMTDRDFDKAGSKFDREKVRGVLATGDIDFPTALARPLLKKAPSLLSLSPMLILRLMRR